jgi:hypothetical protein
VWSCSRDVNSFRWPLAWLGQLQDSASKKPVI